jgi:putative heme-binding domain-containing protein
MTRWSVFACLLAAAAPLPAQQPADVAAGQRLFAANCAVCHGADGTGATTPLNLVRGEFKHGGSDQELFNTVSKGIPGTEMPGSFLNPSEIRQVVAFVKSLGGPSGRAGGAGDAARGEVLFGGKGGCLACHRITEETSHGEAIQFGPSLHGIGERRSVAVLQNAIPRMHRGLSEFRWKVTAVTRSGTRLAGTRLNEDTFSIQLRDPDNNLVSLLKKDLEEWKVEQGEPMPAFPSGLSAAEVSDLAAYLATLRQ